MRASHSSTGRGAAATFGVAAGCTRATEGEGVANFWVGVDAALGATGAAGAGVATATVAGSMGVWRNQMTPPTISTTTTERTTTRREFILKGAAGMGKR